jgi:hypothetical protein
MQLIKPAKPYVRLLCALWLGLYIAWYWLAPLIQKSRGHFDEAAWLPLFLAPFLYCGIPVGLLAVAGPGRITLSAFALISLAYLAVGFGVHPT